MSIKFDVGGGERRTQRAKKVVSNNPRLVDFATRIVIFVLNLPDGQLCYFWGEIKLQKDCNQTRLIKKGLGAS